MYVRVEHLSLLVCLALPEAALHVEADFVLTSSQIRSFVCVTSAEVNIPRRKPISVNESKRNSACCAFCSHIEYNNWLGMLSITPVPEKSGMLSKTNTKRYT